MIANVKDICPKYECKNIIARRYLETHGVPLLSLTGEIAYFAKTELFDKAIKEAPFYIKMLLNKR